MENNYEMDDMGIEWTEDENSEGETGNNGEELDIDDHDISNMDMESLTPYVGRYYASIDEAFAYYKVYGGKCGFGVRKSSSGKSRGTETINRKVFVCDRQGFKRQLRADEQQTSVRAEKRTGCRAKMVIVSTSIGLWKVSMLEELHNHQMLSPSKVNLLYSQTTFHRSQTCRKIIALFTEVGVTPSVIKRLLNLSIPSGERRVTTQQVCDVTRELRKRHIGSECAEVVAAFYRRKVEDPEFYFNFCLDAKGTLKHLFWADRRARADYAKFNDVIVFDVTYRTNKLSLSFAPFTGVNHHLQSTLFACGFMRNETTESFVWLFQEFLKCMNGLHPKAIMTDQDHAIVAAILVVFPDTKHRYCKWHIDGHLKQHVGHLFRSPSIAFKAAYDQWFYSRNSFDEEQRFLQLDATYGLRGKPWFVRLYDKRIHWHPCYMDDSFWAGMKTTQRAESMHSFFDGYVNARTPIDVFVGQYDMAVKDRREAENEEDFYSLTTKPVLLLDHEFEKQAGAFYTRAVFKVFAEEFKLSQTLVNHVIQSSEGRIVYLVGKRGQRDEQKFRVCFEVAGEYIVTCECMFFTKMGVLCRHMLHVMVYNQLEQIPDNYLMLRWSINARVTGNNPTDASSSNGNPVFYGLIKEKLDLVLKAALTDANVRCQVDIFLSDIQRNIESAQVNAVNTSAGSANSGPNLPGNVDHVNILDPVGMVVNKGRPKQMTRIITGHEGNQPKVSNRRCSNCRETGHNISTCLLHKEGQQ